MPSGLKPHHDFVRPPRPTEPFHVGAGRISVRGDGEFFVPIQAARPHDPAARPFLPHACYGQSMTHVNVTVQAHQCT